MSDVMKDRVTIYEVASVAGVSLATVSRVINKHPNVTDETRVKVENAIKKLGYRPSALAQALAKSKTTNIGLIMPSTNYVYMANLLHGITTAAREKGYLITLFLTSSIKKEAQQAMDNLISSHVDGAIVFDDLFEEEEIKKIVQYQVPVVVVNNRIEDEEKVSCITFGYENTLREEIIRKHLQTQNKPMYFVDFPESGRLLERLKRSFVTTHKEENKTPNLLSVANDYDGNYAYFNDLFRKVKKGYFLVHRDSVAMAVVNAALANSLRVPEDIEILSLIGTRYSEMIRPKISAMSLDMQDVGHKAFNMLVEIMSANYHYPREKVTAIYRKQETTR